MLFERGRGTKKDLPTAALLPLVTTRAGQAKPMGQKLDSDHLSEMQGLRYLSQQLLSPPGCMPAGSCMGSELQVHEE